MCRPIVSLALSAACVLAQAPAVQQPSVQQPVVAQPGQTSPEVLTVILVAGRNGTNILRPASAAPPVIEVRDNSDRPVAGAVVKFAAPMAEPTVRFPNGRPTYSLVTDLSGRAAVENMTPVGAGKFEIDVTASYLDGSTTAHVREANYPDQKLAMAATGYDAASQVRSPVEHHMSTGTKVGIIAAIAIAAGVGAYFGSRAVGHSSGTVSAGSPTVGAP